MIQAFIRGSKVKNVGGGRVRVEHVHVHVAYGPTEAQTMDIRARVIGLIFEGGVGELLVSRVREPILYASLIGSCSLWLMSLANRLLSATGSQMEVCPRPSRSVGSRIVDPWQPPCLQRKSPWMDLAAAWGREKITALGSATGRADRMSPWRGRRLRWPWLHLARSAGGSIEGVALPQLISVENDGNEGRTGPRSGGRRCQHCL